MRSLGLLLLPLRALALTPKDESDIRTAIQEYAKIENQQDTGNVWSERGPVTYRIRKIEPVTDDVALAETEGGRTGAFSERLPFLFVMLRSHGQWTVVKRVQVGSPVRLMPICAGPRFWACGSWGCRG